MQLYPGTTVQKKNGVSGKQFLSGLFMGSGGIVMQQLNELTGLKTPTVQNWVSRGFMPHPINKRYSKDAISYFRNASSNGDEIDDGFMMSAISDKELLLYSLSA